MKRKLVLIGTSLLFILGVFVNHVFAQEPVIESDESAIGIPDIIPSYPRPEPGFLGQDHHYSVVFRGNGEAVVTLRVVLTNKQNTGLNEISLRVPKVEPKGASAYQVIREPVCIRYSPANRLACVEYQDPDYYSYYGRAKYQEAEVEYQGDTLTVTLPSSIAVDKSGSFFVFFRAFGYVKKNIFGTFMYEFESLMVEDDIRSLTVGIDTDSDLVLKGTRGEVQYRFEETALSGIAAEKAPVASTALDSFYSQIGRGRIVKTSSNLAPLESYKVEGGYAANRLKLYGKEIVIGLIIVLTLAIFSFAIIKLVFKRLQKATEPGDKKTPETSSLILLSGAVSFVSSLLISGYTAFAILLGGLMTNALSYRYNTMVILFLVLISFGVYSLLLFGPAIYLGVKKGIGWGIAEAVMTIFFMIVFLGIAVLVFFLIGDAASGRPVPIPLLETVAE